MGDLPGRPKIEDPATGQGLAEIEEYLRSVNPGDEVAIRNSQGGFLQYRITVVTSARPGKGRLYTQHAAAYGGVAWYMKSGRNCYSPNGQSQLFIPTDAIRDYIAAHKIPVGGFYAIWHPR